MKSNKGATKAQSQTNGVQKSALTGAVTKAKAGMNKKKQGKQAPVKMVPPKEIEENEEEIDEESDEDSGADVAADVVGDENDSDEDIDDEEDDEDDDDDDDDDEDDELVEGEDDDEEEEEASGLLDNEAAEEEDDDDDDEPAEAPISKKPKGIPRINSGQVPQDIPNDQVLIVQNLPKKFKQIDLVEVFAKFGEIHTIHPVHGEKTSTAFVAFTTAKAAKDAAEATNGKAKVRKATITVDIQKAKNKKNKPEKNPQAKEEKQKEIAQKKQERELLKERCVYVRNLRSNTTEDQVRAHFQNCGVIESVKVLSRNNYGFAFVNFADKESLSEAKKLNNTVLNDANILVFLNNESKNQNESPKDPKRTITIKNVQNLASCPIDKIQAIFSKCGKIEDISILCKKNVLAFITFEDEKSAKKAMKFDGTSAKGLELSMEEFKPNAPKTSVFVQNVKPGTTEEQLREVMETAGPIDNIFIKSGFAIVKYHDVDGFCKSFLLNESVVQGQMIFLEPHSEKKQAVLKHQKPNQGNKRKMPFNKNAGAKRIKQN